VPCARVQCVFVHGWGMNSAVWDSFIKLLPDSIQPVCIDLPGHGEFNEMRFSGLDDLVGHLTKQASRYLDGPAIWVGWSLGALPILKLASQQPDKVKKICLIASNPCFVKQNNWDSAVEAPVFDLFADNLQSNIEKTLQRFLSLQVQGMEDSRDVLRVLRQSIITQGLPSSEALSAGLEVLKNTDLKDDLSALNTPQLWLLGEKDSLVPATLGDYLDVQQGVKSHIISGSAHLPFISHAEETMQQLLAYIQSESIDD